MATVVRSPFVVPNPPNETAVWIADATKQSLTLQLATKFFGGHGQVPTKRWRYDYDQDPALWVGEPAGVPFALRVPSTLFGAPGQVPTKLWRWDPEANPPIWVGSPLSQPFALRVATQFYGQHGQVVTSTYQFEPNDSSAWNWQPNRNASLSQPAGTPVKPYFWSFNIDDAAVWQHKVRRNDPLLTVWYSYVTIVRTFEYAEPPVWQQTYVNNRALTTQPVVQPPTPRWQYNYSDDPAWLRTTYLNRALLSAPVLAAAPTKLWRWDFADHPTWVKAEYRNLALLTAPVLAAFPNKFWRYDYDLDPAIWTWTAPYASALTLPPAVEPPPTGGRGLKHYPHGRRRVDMSKRERGFSRKYFDEMQAAWRAQAELERKAEKEEQAKKRNALAKAAREAEDALLAVEEAEVEVAQQLQRITRTVTAATGAKSLAEVIAASQRVVAASIAAQRKLDEENDDEETILLLMS